MVLPSFFNVLAIAAAVQIAAGAAPDRRMCSVEVEVVMASGNSGTRDGRGPTGIEIRLEDLLDDHPTIIGVSKQEMVVPCGEYLVTAMPSRGVPRKQSSTVVRIVEDSTLVRLGAPVQLGDGVGLGGPGRIDGKIDDFDGNPETRIDIIGLTLPFRQAVRPGQNGEFAVGSLLNGSYLVCLSRGQAVLHVEPVLLAPGRRNGQSRAVVNIALPLPSN